ncbi:hypothetical protein MINS_03940 [Mycolicibacterium insubricum]|nr:hypothetical protein MINS_03940 [Mycolicibacterium insubricum]
MITATPDGRPQTGGGPPAGDEVRTAVRCKHCRHWIVDPISVAAGAGKHCREAHRAR